MYVQRKLVARSRNHCCRGNATMHSLCIAEVHFSVNSIGILTVVRKKYFKDEFMYLAGMKLT